MIFEKNFEAGWRDVDPNGHVRHSVYGDWAADARFALMQREGFPVPELLALGVGPVILREEFDYLREVNLGDTVTVDVRLSGMSDDGRRWRIRQTVRTEARDVAAALLLHGGWLDLQRRKMVAPPDKLVSLLRNMDRTDDYAPIVREPRPA